MGEERYNKTVAVTCLFCGNIITGSAGKKICKSCQLKWEHTIPRHITSILNRYHVPTFTQDLLVWYRIKQYRDKGIYRLDKLDKI
jgi:hypothetical protein